MRRIKNDPNLYFDYKDVKTMQRYIDVYGRIEPIAKTGLSAKQQRQLAVAVNSVIFQNKMLLKVVM